MTTDAEQARRLLEAAEYRPLWDAARIRLERTGLSISNRPVKVKAAGRARVDIAGLVGISTAGTDPLSVRLDRLDATLRSGAAAIDLLSMLERIDGPLTDRREARTRRAEAVASTWRALSEHPTIGIHTRLGDWLQRLRSSGSAARLAGSSEEVGPFVRRALEVIARLPAEGLPLAVFAVDATGDAHALDRSTALGSLVAGALPYVGDSPPDQPADEDAADTGPSWRGSWARVGVVCDELSVSVLVLNLELEGAPTGPVSVAVAEHREAGLPLRLTLQQLRSEELHLRAGQVIRTCENPSVVASAAAALGVGSGPLVCTDGQPNGAVDELLGRVSRAGTRVAHHGDYDWGGIRIANALIARHGVEPWRFSTADYIDAVGLGRVPLDASRHPVAASWDPALVPAMRDAGLCVFEEQVISVLLDDLGR